MTNKIKLESLTQEYLNWIMVLKDINGIIMEIEEDETYPSDQARNKDLNYAFEVRAKYVEAMGNAERFLPMFKRHNQLN